MSVIFKPNGTLNIASEATDLPAQVAGNTVIGEGLTRAKNVRLNQKGKAVNRYGSSRLHDTAMETPVHHIQTQNKKRYSFAGTQIYEDEQSIATGLTKADWSSIKYNAFNDTVQQIFALNGTDRKRLEDGQVYDWGVDPPTDTPIALIGNFEDSSLTGSYGIRVTLIRKNASGAVVYESNPGPKSNIVSLTSDILSVTFERPNNTSITHARIYRTLSTGLTYFFDVDVATPYVQGNYDYAYTYPWEAEEGFISGPGNQITSGPYIPSGGTELSGATDVFYYTHSWEADLTSQTDDQVATNCFTHELILYSSVTSDGSLGVELATDHDRVPAGSFVIGPSFNGTCFALKDNLVYYCKPKQPEYWPALYNIEVSNPQFPALTALFFSGALYVLTKLDIYLIRGTEHGSFFPIKMKTKTGVQGAYGALAVSDRGIFHVGGDGIYLFNGVFDKNVTDEALSPIFNGESRNGIPACGDLATAWLGFFENSLYFGYAGVDEATPTNALVTDLDKNQTRYYRYSNGLQMNTIAVDEDDEKLLVGTADGYNWEIEDKSQVKDNTMDVPWELQSMEFTLQTRPHFPRYAKYDADTSKAIAAVGKIILDDAVLQEHTLADKRDVRRRLIKGDNGNRMAVQLSGSGPVEVYAVEME